MHLLLRSFPTVLLFLSSSLLSSSFTTWATTPLLRRVPSLPSRESSSTRFFRRRVVVVGVKSRRSFGLVVVPPHSSNHSPPFHGEGGSVRRRRRHLCGVLSAVGEGEEEGASRFGGRGGAPSFRRRAPVPSSAAANSSLGDASPPFPSRPERIRRLLDRIDDRRSSGRRGIDDFAMMDRVVAEDSDALEIAGGDRTRSETDGFEAEKDGDGDDPIVVVHYVFLVHGWLGNDSEMGYLDDALRDVLIGPSASPSSASAVDAPSASSSSSADFGAGNVVVHRATCNNGRTTDGIERGGSRLVEEILRFVESDLRSRIFDDDKDRRMGKRSEEEEEGEDGDRSDEEKKEGSSFEGGDPVGPAGTGKGGRRRLAAARHHVTVSFVGNSLGGLYSRYAAAHLPEMFALTSAAADAAATVPPPPSPVGRRSSRLDLLKSSTMSFDTALTSAPSSSVDEDEDDDEDGFYMLAEQDEEEQSEQEETVTVVLHPNVFCTTATPHLGVASHTYLPIPRLAERAIGNGMAATGRDLFRLASSLGVSAKGGPEDGSPANDAGVAAGIAAVDVPRSKNLAAADVAAPSTSTNRNDDGKPKDLIYEMSTSPQYLDPLSKFRKRIAYANAFRTDFQVPTKTAAFLCDRSEYPHFHRRRTTRRRRATAAASASTARSSSAVDKGGRRRRRSDSKSSSREGDGDGETEGTETGETAGGSDVVGVGAAAATTARRGSRFWIRRGKRDEPVAPSASTEPPAAVAPAAAVDPDRNVEPDDGRRKAGGGTPNDEGRSFVVMALETERRYEISASPPSSREREPVTSPPSFSSSTSSSSSPSSVVVDDNGVLEMSESLDSLGWTKIFVDVRDRIPAPSVSLPSFFKRKDSRTELDDFLERRHSDVVSSSSKLDETNDDDGDDDAATKLRATSSGLPGDDGDGDETTVVRISSKELVDLMNPSERLHVPLGHTVMVANSKSEWYSKINAKGRPVMDKLAKDLVTDVKRFRREEVAVEGGEGWT